MRSAHALAGAWAATLLLSGCAGTGRQAPGPLISPTGVVYQPGTPPTETRSSQTAALYLRQNRVDRALELAVEGIAESPGNPIHYFLAGVAYARRQDYAGADSMFDSAERIYPAYQLQVEPEREAAWGRGFNAGLEAYEAGDIDETVRHWSGAARIYDLRPQAHRNLASLLASETRYDEAIEAYQGALAGLDKRPATRLLRQEELDARERIRAEIEEDLSELLLLTSRFAEAEPLLRHRLERDPESVELRAELAATLSGMGREAEARELYSSLLSEESLELTQTFSLGVGLFRAGEYLQAAEAFQRVIALQPESRDAWFNYANSLFAAEAWDSLAAAGSRLLQLDPLGETAGLMVARALLELGDRQGALARLDEVDGSPVHVKGLQMQRSRGTIAVFGQVTGNAAEPGASVDLRFSFYGEGGVGLGSEILRLVAPPSGETEHFQVPFAMDASAYRYELLH